MQTSPDPAVPEQPALLSSNACAPSLPRPKVPAPTLKAMEPAPTLQVMAATPSLEMHAAMIDAQKAMSAEANAPLAEATAPAPIRFARAGAATTEAAATPTLRAMGKTSTRTIVSTSLLAVNGGRRVD